MDKEKELLQEYLRFSYGSEYGQEEKWWFKFYRKAEEHFRKTSNIEYEEIVLPVPAKNSCPPRPNIGQGRGSTGTDGIRENIFMEKRQVVGVILH